PRFHWLYGSALVTGAVGSILGGLTWLTGLQLARGAWGNVFSSRLVASHQENVYMALVAFSAVFGGAAFLRYLRIRFPNWNLEGTWLRVGIVVGLSLGCFYLFSASQEGVRLTRQLIEASGGTIHAR